MDTIVKIVGTYTLEPATLLYVEQDVKNVAKIEGLRLALAAALQDY